jgi:hypothetical protein
MGRVEVSATSGGQWCTTSGDSGAHLDLCWNREDEGVRVGWCWARVGRAGNGKPAKEGNSWVAQDNRKGRKIEPWVGFEDSAQEVTGNINPLLFLNSFINWKLI